MEKRLIFVQQHPTDNGIFIINCNSQEGGGLNCTHWQLKRQIAL